LKNALFLGVPSGGIKITVVGENFGFIQNPKMYVYYQEKMFISQCEILSDKEMLCDSPAIDTDSGKLSHVKS
jgi:plexin A